MEEKCHWKIGPLRRTKAKKMKSCAYTKTDLNRPLEKFEFWTRLFARFSSHWSAAPSNNIDNLGFLTVLQGLLVFLGREANQILKLFSEGKNIFGEKRERNDWCKWNEAYHFGKVCWSGAKTNIKPLCFLSLSLFHNHCFLVAAATMGRPTKDFFSSFCSRFSSLSSVTGSDKRETEKVTPK